MEMYGPAHCDWRVTGEAPGFPSFIASCESGADTCSMVNPTNEDLRNFGRKVEEKFNEAKPRVEEEVKKVIAYLNDEVVPGVRENSSKALRVAAEQLAKLADHLDRNKGGRQG